MSKECSACRVVKEQHEFNIDKRVGDGYARKCRLCIKKETAARYSDPEYRARMNEISRRRYAENEHVREQRARACKKYLSKPENKRKHLELCYKSHRKRKHGLKYRLNNSISSSISAALRESKRGKSWKIMVEYTIEELMAHLESQFQDRMGWENYGEWHIDHIIPISAFNYTTPEHEDFKRCWALENLQPLWASENSAKKDKLAVPFQPSLPM